MINSVISQVGGSLGYMINSIKHILTGPGCDIFHSIMTEEQITTIEEDLERYKKGDYAQQLMDIVFVALAHVLGTVIVIVDSHMKKRFPIAPATVNSIKDLRVVYVHRATEQHYNALIPVENIHHMQQLHEVLPKRSERRTDISFLKKWEGERPQSLLSIDEDDDEEELFDYLTYFNNVQASSEGGSIDPNPKIDEACSAQQSASDDLQGVKKDTHEQQASVCIHGQHNALVAPLTMHENPTDQILSHDPQHIALDLTIFKGCDKDQGRLPILVSSDQSEPLDLRVKAKVATVSDMRENSPGKLSTPVDKREPPPGMVATPVDKRKLSPSKVATSVDKGELSPGKVANPVDKTELPPGKVATPADIREISLLHEIPEAQKPFEPQHTMTYFAPFPSSPTLKDPKSPLDSLQEQDTSVCPADSPEAGSDQNIKFGSMTACSSIKTRPLKKISTLYAEFMNNQQMRGSGRDITSEADEIIDEGFSGELEEESEEECFLDAETGILTYKSIVNDARDRPKALDDGDDDENQEVISSGSNESLPDIPSATPVYSESITDSKDELLAILLSANQIDSDRVCSKVPYRPQQNCAFVLDTDSGEIKSRDDVKSDGNGTYRGYGKDIIFYSHEKKRVKDRNIRKYTLLTRYYKHKGSPDFNRKIVELSVLTENGTESWSPYIILIYYFRGDPHPITVQSHGNSMGSKAYSRAKPSTVNRIKEQSQKGKLPKEIYESIISEEGGYMKADNSSAFPRSLQQIYDVRRTRKLEDDLVHLIKMSREPDGGVLAVNEGPHLLVVLGYEWQLDLLSMCVTNEQLKSIVSIDVVWNCTPYLVTPLALRHPLLINTNTGKSPCILGPVCISDSQTAEIFEIFARTLVRRRKPMAEGNLILGSDSQTSIMQGFAAPFKSVQHILCTRHIENNLRKKLISAPTKISNEILEDVLFGKNSLANCTTEEFDAHLDSYKEKWENLSAGFHHWFQRFQATKFKRGVILSARQSAGLDVDEMFFNNTSEAMNNVLKTGMTANSSLKDLYDNYSKICRQTILDIELSIINHGSYSITTKFRPQFEVTEETWEMMSVKQREKVRDKLLLGRVRPLKQTLEKVTRTQATPPPSRKSRKPNEKIRNRRNRNRCLSQIHSMTEYYHITLSSAVKDGYKCHQCSSNIKKCKKGIDTFVCRGKYWDKEKRKKTAYVHLLCLSRSLFYSRKFHLCPEYERCLTESQLDLLPMSAAESDFGESDDTNDAEEY